VIGLPPPETGFVVGSRVFFWFLEILARFVARAVLGRGRKDFPGSDLWDRESI
jgi:hypothetical protein